MFSLETLDNFFLPVLSAQEADFTKEQGQESESGEP